MKIDILTHDGSPIGVTPRTIWGDGVQIGCGGAELALLTVCEELTKRGHEVTLYNDPREQNVGIFQQKQIRSFTPKEHRDILIVFRSPNPRAIYAEGYKVWWSCDQYTSGNFQDFAPSMDKIVVISPFHAQYFEQLYGIKNTVVTDLPVRRNDYEQLWDKNIERIPNRFLFSTVPDRGLQNLWRMWPKIRQEIPDATLTITSDYRLWGVGCRNEVHRMRWITREGVQFLGAIPRKQLLEEQLKSSYMLYPGNYPELFCIAVSEAQYTGIRCVTSGCGALETTNMDEVIKADAGDAHNDKSFVNAMLQIANNNVPEDRLAIQEKARQRFDPDKIIDFWEQNILKGAV